MPVQTQTQNYIQNSIRDSLLSSHHTAASNAEDHDGLQNKLISNVKRILTKSIEYEEVDPYTTAQFNGLKDKYTVLNGGQCSNNNTGNSAKLQSGEKAASSQGTNGVPAGSQLPQPKRILFSRDEVQIGWKASGRRWQVGAGMMNVGNTCYLNSTLQAVFHVPAMANWLMSDAKHRESCEDDGGGQNGCIICAMARTLIASQSNQNAIKPWKVYTKLRLVCKHLTLGRQEDAHEFLRYLIESMEKLYLGRFKNSKDLDQYSKETTPLNQILGGYLRSAVKCLSCQHVSTTYQHFQDLLLDIRKANSVEEALDGYFARERLEDMGYKCEACKKRVSATKQFTLERAPIALCIQLKRFSMMGSKLNKHVQIKQRLDMSTYASQSLKRSTDKLNYRLVSMVTHLGSSQNCGHYTAIGLHESGSYYQFDDSCVRPINIQSVMNTNAYIIFYELEDGSRPANSSSNSTMTSSSVFLNENVNGMNGANNKRPQDNGLASTSSQYHSNNKCNGNNEANRSNFIGPQLPHQLQQQQTKRDDTTSPTKTGKPNAITFSEYANRKQAKAENGGNDVDDSSPFNFNRSLKLNENGGSNGLANGLPAKHDKLVIHFKNTKADSQLKSPTVTIGQASGVKSPLSVKKAISFSSDTSDPLLPSMPTLTNGTPDGSNKSPKFNKLEAGTVTPSKSTTATTISPNTKRLVPYETDDSDDEDTTLKNGDNTNGYSTTSSLSVASNDDDIVQTKAGQFQVSDSSIKRPSKHGSTSKSSYSVQDGSPPNKPVTTFNQNGVRNGQQNGFAGNGNTVNGLLKMSYRGYGSAGVQSWNGERSAMDTELLQEKRLERKRRMNADEEDDAEMDRGRVKKAKSSSHYNNGNGNGGYNPFQEQQNRQFNGNSNGYQQRNSWTEPSTRYYNNNDQQNGNQKNFNFNHRQNNYNNNSNFNRNNNFRNNNNKRPFHNNSRRGGGNYYRGNFNSRY